MGCGPRGAVVSPRCAAELSLSSPKVVHAAAKRARLRLLAAANAAFLIELQPDLVPSQLAHQITPGGLLGVNLRANLDFKKEPNRYRKVVVALHGRWPDALWLHQDHAPDGYNFLYGGVLFNRAGSRWTKTTTITPGWFGNAAATRGGLLVAEARPIWPGWKRGELRGRAWIHLNGRRRPWPELMDSTRHCKVMSLAASMRGDVATTSACSIGVVVHRFPPGQREAERFVVPVSGKVEANFRHDTVRTFVAQDGRVLVPGSVGKTAFLAFFNGEKWITSVPRSASEADCEPSRQPPVAIADRVRWAPDGSVWMVAGRQLWKGDGSEFSLVRIETAAFDRAGRRRLLQIPSDRTGAVLISDAWIDERYVWALAWGDAVLVRANR